MTTSDRIVKWSIELGEYDLEFWPKKSIKAQVLADFVAECSFQKSQEVGQQSASESGDQQVVANKEMDIWSVYVDGSSA